MIPVSNETANVKPSARKSTAISPARGNSAGPNATRAAKQLARRVHSADETARLIAEHRTSDEGQSRLRAFLDR